MLLDWQRHLPGGHGLITPSPGRHARLHVPRHAPVDAPLPLVCMLHGCTQNADSFAAATLMDEAADRHGFAVVYPQQERHDNQNCCWNWFLPAHQARGGGEPESIAGIVRELAAGRDGLKVDSSRVFVAGLSAGGAMATVMAATYPDLFAGVAVHSGLPYRSATNVIGAFAAMAGRGGQPAGLATPRAVPAMVIHGSADRTVAPANGEAALLQWMDANRLAGCDLLDPRRPATSARLRADGGHPYTRSQWVGPDGSLLHELITVEGMGHAWSGGAPGGSFTDPRGPDASEAIWRFFSSL